MAKPARRGRGTPLRTKEDVAVIAPRSPLRILLERTRQGCYGVCAGSVVAIPAALLGEHVPSLHVIVMLGGVGLFAGTAGVMIEVFENRIFPGGENVS
jgi:hypothetical protein